MLVLELGLDERAVLTDRQTGKKLAEVKIASFVQYPSHNAVRLGFDAPQSTYISRRSNGSKGLGVKDVEEKTT